MMNMYKYEEKKVSEFFHTNYLVEILTTWKSSNIIFFG